MIKEITLSVHQLVDFLLRTGDIDNRVFNASSMQEGTRIHTRYQESQDSDYWSEYPLKRTFTINGVDVTLEGRADGIIKKKDGSFVIDEIKSTVEDLQIFRDQNIEWHLGQVKCYALMFMLEQQLDEIDMRIVYIRQGKEKQRLVDRYSSSLEELKKYVYGLIEDYLDFHHIIELAIERRNASIKDLKFPFGKYRKGQRELAKYAYAIAKNGGRLFVEAPTGIGKTMSTLFPYIKCLSDDDQSKIFYLTAKSSGKESAYQAVELLKEKSGLSINDIVITAKEKICFCKEGNCNPDECPYAKGYYNKIQGVLQYALTNYSTFDYKTITQIALDNYICPFEFELDLSLFCDIIICDYNYMFDPISYMKRYFDEDASRHLVLVDETHNLVDRSKDMYSASLSFRTLKEARKSLKPVKNAKIKKYLGKIKTKFIDLFDNSPLGDTIIDNLDGDLFNSLYKLIDVYQDTSKNSNEDITKELTDYYLEVNRFLKLYDLYDETIYRLYIHRDEYDVSIHLYCIDASSFVRRSTNQVKSCLFFSATLSPIDYYVETLGGTKEDGTLLLTSPFPKENFKLLVAPKVSIKYANRESSYHEVAEYIKAFVKEKVGNYFIYSPSYEYMNRLKDFIDLDADVYYQNRDMSDLEKVEFLDNFPPNPEKTAVGFLVLGGAFSEGIDLISDRLIGAVIIGIGMPKINFESDLIAKYYAEKGFNGHEYAYTNPGMNKVMQAVGRVIRSETDKGAALLIDERYMYRNYQRLFRSEWQHYDVVLYPEEVKEQIEKFFKE
ncbi:MAG: ATP-dependent DNA helicase [Bacilli bacterium]|nr:ATP-dependent DNA helicase [Bacilli bacterium]